MEKRPLRLLVFFINSSLRWHGFTAAIRRRGFLRIRTRARNSRPPCLNGKIYRSGHGYAPIPGLAADNDVGRTVGRSHFARAYFLPAAASRIQGPPLYAHKISHHEGER